MAEKAEKGKEGCACDETARKGITMSGKIEQIKQEATNLEIDFADNGETFDLDKRGGGIGGTFANNAAGQADAQDWLANYRTFVEANDQDRSKS